MERGAGTRRLGRGRRRTPSSASSRPPPTGNASRHAGHAHRQRPPHRGAAGRVALRPPPGRPASACRRRASPRASARNASSKSRAGWSCSRRRPSAKRTSTRGAGFACRARCRVAADAGDVECHTMRRGQMRIERQALHLPATPSDDGARSRRRARRRSHRRRDDRRGDRSRDRSDSRTRDRSGDHHRRRPADRSRDRRAGRRHVVREPAALRRLGRHVADPLRHRASGPPADAHARRLSEPRDRGTPRRSADHLRGRARRQLDDARPVLPPERLHDRAEPVSIDHRDRGGGRQAHDDEPGDDRPSQPAADPSQRARLRPADHQRPRRRRRGGVHAGHRSRRTKIGSSRSWTSARTRSCSLGNRHRILAASCPAGPAFEGGAIACGMPGLDGAIEDVVDR